MIEPGNFALFLAATVVIIATPGQDMLLVIARSLAGGARDGVLVASGLIGGLVLHTAIVALGLAALLAASAAAFSAIKWLGAAYLVWLGIQALRAPAEDPAGIAAPARRAPRALLLQGFLSAALNPKLALFFLAFLPQFADGRLAPLALQLALLGVLFSMLGFLSYAALAIVIGRSRGAISARARRVLGGVSGVLLIGLGLRLALVER